MVIFKRKILTRYVEAGNALYPLQNSNVFPSSDFTFHLGHWQNAVGGSWKSWIKFPVRYGTQYWSHHVSHLYGGNGLSLYTPLLLRWKSRVLALRYSDPITFPVLLHKYDKKIQIFFLSPCQIRSNFMFCIVFLYFIFFAVLPDVSTIIALAFHVFLKYPFCHWLHALCGREAVFELTMQFKLCFWQVEVCKGFLCVNLSFVRLLH